jgi:hypothetical protein
LPTGSDCRDRRPGSASTAVTQPRLLPHATQAIASASGPQAQGTPGPMLRANELESIQDPAAGGDVDESLSQISSRRRRPSPARARGDPCAAARRSWFASSIPRAGKVACPGGVLFDVSLRLFASRGQVWPRGSPMLQPAMRSLRNGDCHVAADAMTSTCAPGLACFHDSRCPASVWWSCRSLTLFRSCASSSPPLLAWTRQPAASR